MASLPEEVPVKIGETVMPKVGGKGFRCICGCNVFTWIEEHVLKCNACPREYTDLDTDEWKVYEGEQARIKLEAFQGPLSLETGHLHIMILRVALAEGVAGYTAVDIANRVLKEAVEWCRAHSDESTMKTGT